MKILIAGATGLIGNELGKTLSDKGHQLVVLTRNPDNSQKRCPFPHESISWSELSDHPLTQNIDHIINLAGAGIADRRWSNSYKETLVKSRTKTTSQLVAFANSKEKQIQSFISTSAVGYYGDCKDTVIDESQKAASTFLAQLCQNWEKPLEQLAQIRSVIYRPGVVLSEKGGALDKMAAPIQMGVGGPLGDGQQYMSWIDIDDLVNLYVYALENSISGTFNACAPHPISNKKLTDTIAQRFNKPAPFKVPYFALRLAVGEMASSLVESQNVSSKKIQEAGFQFKFDTIESSIKKRIPPLKTTEKRAIYQQWVPKERNEIFPFFSDAKNLESLTPDHLKIKILSSSTDSIEKGTEISYRLKINGVPLKWKTLITDWDPPRKFTDNQESGPYKKWHHTHKFSNLAGGTLMTDQVDYIVPMGLLGYGLTHWKVQGDLQTIFNYRKEKIHKLFYK